MWTMLETTTADMEAITMTTQPEPTPAPPTDPRAVDLTSLASKAYQEGRARAMNDDRRADELHGEVMRQIHLLTSRLTATERPADGVVSGLIDSVLAAYGVSEREIGHIVTDMIGNLSNAGYLRMPGGVEDEATNAATERPAADTVTISLSVADAKELRSTVWDTYGNWHSIEGFPKDEAQWERIGKACDAALSAASGEPE
jgi:hypothetical protein